MKKLYVLATALFIGASAQAQTIDFESFGLAPNSFDNGSSGTVGGEFEFLGGDVILTNFYDTAWGGYWSEFSISNMNDVVTPGSGNQYSAYPGSGANSSETFAMLYSNGFISATTSYISIDSFYIANATYSALSMLNGDPGGYGKEFGTSVSGDIHGNIPDGSNGEDFYRVWVYGADEFGNIFDSSVVYLADYRFADNNLDYISNDWMKVDLTGYSAPVSSVSFKFESSDTTGGFINTPTYMAVDNISVKYGLGFNENQLTNISMYPNPATDQLMIKGEEGVLTITSLTGEVLYSEDHAALSKLDVSNYSNGVYVIQLINASGSYTNRFIKQ